MHSWILRRHNLKRGRLPLLMGILNVTPDSFSDGGRFDEADRAIEQARLLRSMAPGFLTSAASPLDQAPNLCRLTKNCGERSP